MTTLERNTPATTQAEDAACCEHCQEITPTTTPERLSLIKERCFFEQQLKPGEQPTFGLSWD